MPWTEITRPQDRRAGMRYSSDMTDDAWALIAPHLPPARRLGRPRTTDLRAVIDALLYLLTTGCQWRLLPKEFPPYSTVQRFFYGWREDGMWPRINHDLLQRARVAMGRAASPSAGVIDRQSVKTTEAGGPRASLSSGQPKAGPGGRRQAGQGQETAHPDRHQRSSGGGLGAPGRRPGP